MGDEAIFLAIVIPFFIYLIINSIIVSRKDKVEVKKLIQDASDGELLYIISKKGGITLNSWEADKHNRRLYAALKELKKRGYDVGT